MNKLSIITLAAILTIGLSFFACKKDEEGSGSDCYTCDSCAESPYINGTEYCVDGFDNRSDWESAKNQYQTKFGCTCTDS